MHLTQGVLLGEADDMGLTAWPPASAACGRGLRAAGWARHHGVRATVCDLSDEDRQELWESFQALTQDYSGNHTSGAAAEGNAAPAHPAEVKCELHLPGTRKQSSRTRSWPRLRTWCWGRACTSA